MKRSLLLFVLAACGAELSAEPLDISAAPLRIELPQPIPEPFLPVWPSLMEVPAIEVRGFKFRDVGPRKISGPPSSVGTLAHPAVKYTFPIIEKVRGAVFYDVGFVSSGVYDFSLSNVNIGTGLSMRLDVPIGPVRLDYDPATSRKTGADEAAPSSRSGLAIER